MPVSYTKRVYQALYSEAGDDGNRVTYGRHFRGPQFANRAAWLTGPGGVAGGPILVVGSAFGYLIEALEEAGHDDVWGLDPSPYIWTRAQYPEWAHRDIRLRTADDWAGSGTEAASLEAIGAPDVFAYVIDEDCGPAHDDAELPAFHEALEALTTADLVRRVIHIVTPADTPIGRDSSQNWKPLEEWEAGAPAHQWVASLEAGRRQGDA